MSVIDEKLIRMRAIAIQSSNGALLAADRSAMNVEFQQLKSEITRIANTTNYNGNYLIDGTYSGAGTSGLKFHIGTYNTNGQDYYHISINTMTAPVANEPGTLIRNRANVALVGTV